MARDGQRRARDPHVSRSPAIERDARHERESRHAFRLLHRERLRHAAADTMTDDACARDAESVEQCHQSLGVRSEAKRAPSWWITASVAEQVEHHEASAGRHQRDDIAPEVARGGEAVHEHHRVASAA